MEVLAHDVTTNFTFGKLEMSRSVNESSADLITPLIRHLRLSNITRGFLGLAASRFQTD